MFVRAEFLRRVECFRAQHEIGRGAFGLVTVGDRDFLRDVEAGKAVTLDRIEAAEHFMNRVAAGEPAALERLGQAPQQARSWRETLAAVAVSASARGGVEIVGERAQDSGAGAGRCHAAEVTAAQPARQRDSIPRRQGRLA